MEAYSISVSKQLCPKPVAPVLWRLEEVVGHWDRIEILSEVEEDGAWVTYQRGTVAAMRDPRDLLRVYEEAGHRLAPGLLMFGGTLPVIGSLRPRRNFRFRLHDPVRGETIAHRYTVRWLPA